jgi:glycolate oxidase iron-sulfur subunit
MRAPKPDPSLLADLDRCVKCGLCLPECPTYRLAADENESPRGRLALIEGLVTGRLKNDTDLVRHLDTCLQCRRCERVCPSAVPYGRLIDAARQQTTRPRRLTGWLMRPAVLRHGNRLANAIPTALSRPIDMAHRLHRLAAALPPGRPAPRPGNYPGQLNTGRGRVGLFPGCATGALQGDALWAAVTLLNRAGFDVRIPRDHACCGALAGHAGDTATADQLAARNRRAFDADLDAVLSIASGCGTYLDQYQPALTCPHLDIQRFLLEQADLDLLDFHTLAATVLLHTPCTVANVYRGDGWSRSLLQRIAELNIVDVGQAGQCCGSAGDYMLRYPETAEQLRRPVIEQSKRHAATMLLTGNIGCAMHLADGLREEGPPIEVLHPVQLLARQLAT